jgi:hypothetical protein
LADVDAVKVFRFPGRAVVTQTPHVEHVLSAMHAELAKLKAQVARLQASSRDPSDEWLTVPLVVLRTGKPHETVRGWIRAGYLRASRWGASRQWHIRAADLEAFLKGEV